MDEKDKLEEVIYCHEGGKLMWIGFHYIINLILSVGIGISFALGITIVLLFFLEFQIWVFRILCIIFSLLFFYRMLKSERRSKPSYKIYNDRIEFFNKRYPLEKDIIDLEDIDQVRYEDDFGKSYSSSIPSSSFMYCYFKDGYKSKSNNIKKNRLILVVGRNEEGKKSIIRILTFFQKKKKQVYISTRHEKIKKALNLKNWTDPGISPSI